MVAMVYVLSSQVTCVSAILDGRPVTAAHQPVMLHVITTHVMPRPGSVTAPLGIQVTCVVAFLFS